MRLPVVAPMNDYGMENVLRMLRDIRNNISNLGSGNAAEVLQQYQRWAGQSVQTLGYAFDHPALDRLILTRRHWWLMETTVTSNGPAILDAFRAEQADRIRVFDGLIQQYSAIAQRWGGVLSKLVVPDTNFFLHHEKRFDQADWAELVHPGTYSVRVLVPIAVVRELDRKKTAAKNITVGDTSEPLRTRARTTVRELRSLLQNPDWVANVNRTVELELLLDPIGHRPLDDTDAEIIDRTLVAKRITGKDIAILTGDGGMEFNAKIDGLSVISM